jgi:hypothetical protein
MNNYIVMLRVTTRSELMVAAESESAALERAQRLFEASHSQTIETVLGEVIPSPLPPLFPPINGGAL